jgi:hypothetical protein
MDLGMPSTLTKCAEIGGCLPALLSWELGWASPELFELEAPLDVTAASADLPEAAALPAPLELALEALPASDFAFAGVLGSCGVVASGMGFAERVISWS